MNLSEHIGELSPGQLIGKGLSQADNLENLEQDYADLFSGTKKGHMAKYVHMHTPYVYEDIQQDCYYPFRMEREILIQKADQINKTLQGVTQVIELGPGSRTPVISKTVPLLRSLRRQSSLAVYMAMDSTIEYAKQACRIVEEQFPGIKTKATEIDFLCKKSIEKTKNSMALNKRSLLLSLGQSIFANHTDESILTFLKNIGILLNKGDYFLFGVDTNRDPDSLQKAYNTKLSYNLLLNVMHNLKNKLNLINFYPEAFDFIYKWNDRDCVVELSLRATLNQTIKIKNRKYFINEKQEFNILNSRKPDIEKVKIFANKSNLLLVDLLKLKKQKINNYYVVIAKNKFDYLG